MKTLLFAIFCSCLTAFGQTDVNLTWQPSLGTGVVYRVSQTLGEIWEILAHTQVPAYTVSNVNVGVSYWWKITSITCAETNVPHNEIAVSVVLVPVPDNAPQELPGLVGYWPLDDQIGTFAAGNPAALQFGASDFSVSLWVRRNAPEKTFASHGGVSAGGRRWQFSQHGNGGTRFMFLIDDDAAQYKSVSGSKVPGEAWTHLVGVRDGVNLRLYEDGSEVPGSPVNIAGYGSITSTRGLLFGASQTESTGAMNEFWPGSSVSDVRIFNRAVSPAEVQTLYGLGLAPVPVVPPPYFPVANNGGPLRVSHNGHGLVKADGAPFFWLFDTAWRIWKLNPSEVDYYLTTRSQQGFNGLQMHLGHSAFNVNYAGHRPYLGDNTDRPNENYWQNIDSIIAKAGNMGMHVALFPLWGHEFNAAFGDDTAKARRLGHWLGTRYKNASNLVWAVSGEYDAINGYSVPVSAAQKSVLDAFAQALDGGLEGRHILSIHPGAAWTSSLEWHGSGWLDFHMIQSGSEADRTAYGHLENHALVAADYGKSPTRPVLDSEPFYENHPDGVFVYQDVNRPRGGPDVVRRKAYWAIFSGACGHTYGHGNVYTFNVPAFPGQVVQLPTGPGWNGLWTDFLNAPGALHMRHVKVLIESRDMASRVPDQGLVQDTLSGTNKIVAARGANYALVYSPTGKPFTANLGRIPGATVRCQWYDPRTGTYSNSITHENSGTRFFAPPTAGTVADDWILVLDSLP